MKYIFEQKRGISLIAVLMFMLAASTASVVLFRWISSENFSSGSRLKQSEAYQAAESGVDAVHAWLSNKGADVGSLVGNYFYTYSADGKGTKKTSPAPIHLTGSNNNILGIVNTDDNKQKFNVYLTGIDEKNTNSIKFKFLSVGEGRDGSKVTLAAIFDVAGLYQMNVLGMGERDLPPPSDFDYAYFGGSINFQGDKHFSSAVVNGNWSGNPPTVDKDFIVTGNLGNSGDKVTVGGTLCVGGIFDPDNKNSSVGAAYVGSAPKFQGSFGNVYCNGDMIISADIAKTKNLSINGKLSLKESTHKLVVDGNLVIGESNNNAYIDGDNARTSHNGATDANIVVCGDVWTNNPSGVRINNNDNNALNRGKNIRFNVPTDNDNGCTVSSTPDPVLSFSGAVTRGNTNPNYRTANSGGYFYSPAANDFKTENKPKDASAVKDYCDTKWDKLSSPEDHCSGTGYVVKDPIASTLGEIKEFLIKKANEELKEGEDIFISLPSGSFNCVREDILTIKSNGIVYYGSTNLTSTSTTIVKVLNQCYLKLNTSDNKGKLYGGKYLVMKLHQSEDYSLSEKLKGNFILIYPNELFRLAIAPTTGNSGVMLFLEKGVNMQDAEMKSSISNCLDDSAECKDSYGGGTVTPANNGIPANNCPFNYFIYSLKQINKINNFPAKCPLHGSLYFPVNSCAGVTNADNNFGGISNPDLVQALTDAKVLCKRSDGTYSEDCTQNEKYGITIGGEKERYVYEIPDKTYWLPVSSRLKATLMSKKITREKIPETNDETPKPSVLVTPRVIRLTKDAFEGSSNVYAKLKDFYSLTYLTGAPELNQDPNNPNCRSLLEDGKSIEEEVASFQGLPDNKVLGYRCSFSSSDPKYSDFYVNIGGKKGEPKVRLDHNTLTLTSPPPACAPIKLETTSRGEFPSGLTISVGAHDFSPAVSHGWEIIAPNSLVGNGCTVSPNDVPSTSWSVICSAAFTGPDIATFNVCSKNSSDLSVKLKINTSNIPSSQNESIIKREYSELTIERTQISNLPSGFVRCPPEFLTGNWLKLTCTPEPTKQVSQSNTWLCPAVTNLSASLIPGSIPSACKVSSSYTLQTAQNALNSSISGAVAAGSQTVTFPFELEWQSHTIKVVGGTLNYSTNARDIPVNEATGTVSDGSRFKAYRGAVYTISLGSGKLQATCSSNLTCNPTPPMILDPSRQRTGSVTAAGDGTITLDVISSPSVSCPSASISKGSTFMFGNIMPIKGYECNTAAATYKFNGTQYGSNQTVPSSATNNLNGNQSVSVSYNCDGTPHTGICDLNIAGMTLECIKSSYTVGQTAQRPTITCSYGGESRTAREAEFYVGDVRITGWDNLDANGNRPNAVLNNAGTITLKKLRCGNNNPVVDIDPPIECGVVATDLTPPPSTDDCLSVAYSGPCKEHPSPTPDDPMQKCIKAPDCKCYMCNGIDNNCENDWFWKGTWENAWPSQGWLRQVDCSTGSNVTVTVTSCKIGDFGNSVSGTTCYNIPRPNISVTCSNGSTAGETVFEVAGTPINEWSEPGGIRQFCTAGPRLIKLISVKCGDAVITEGLPSGGYSCGYINVEPNNANITCSTSNLDPCYTRPANIPRPTVTCISGGQSRVPEEARFYISVPGSSSLSQVTAWNSKNGLYSPNNDGDNRIVTLRSIECNDITRPLNPYLECGSVNVRSSCGGPTPSVTSCTMGSVTIPSLSGPDINGSYYYSIPKPAITINCSQGMAGAPIFQVNNTTLNWSGNTGTNHPFYSEGTKTVILTDATCDGSTATGFPKTCGSFAVPSINAPLTVKSCSFSSNPLNVTLGQNINSPTIICSNDTQGDKTSATFSANTNRILPNDWSPWKNGNPAKYDLSQTNAIGSNVISVSGVKCGGNTISGSTSCGTITVNAAGGGGTEITLNGTEWKQITDGTKIICPEPPSQNVTGMVCCYNSKAVQINNIVTPCTNNCSLYGHNTSTTSAQSIGSCGNNNYPKTAQNIGTTNTVYCKWGQSSC